MREQEPPRAGRAPNPEAGGTSRLAEFLRRNREHILADWEQALRERRPEAWRQGTALREHLPAFLDRLADAADHLREGHPPEVPEAPLHEQDLERLEQGYEPGELVREYGLLRRCILRRLREEPSPPSLDELMLLDEALDEGVMQATTHYARTRERMLRALERVSQVALESESVEAFLPRALQVLMETVARVDGASILLREGERLHLRAAVGLGAREALASGFSIALDEGLTGQLVARRQPLEVRSASTHPLLRSELVRRLGIRAGYGVPLQHGDTLVGVAYMSSRTVYEFAEADKLLFRTLATRATAFLVQAELAERERAARAGAQRSLAQLDTLLKEAPVGIAFLDRELRFVRVNETMARLTGHPVAAHLGRTFRERVPAGVAEHFEPLLLHALHTGVPVFDDTFDAASAPEIQPPRAWLGHLFPVRTADGEVLGLGCVLVDITAQKRVEGELRRTAELREQLVAVVGHDLRNPLNAITASAWLLARQEELDEGSQRAVERIRTSAARMGRMLRDILDFARSSLGGGLPVHFEPTCLHEVCRRALEELRVAYPGRRLELELEGEDSGCWDADRLEQVVGNLVGNALQHGRADTPVRVTVRDAGPEVLLGVHNQGEPISPALRDALFQPFRRGTTGKAATRSVGLGLYIVRQVALAHGGEVTVHSTEAGTTFTVRLPRRPPAPPRA